MARRLVQHTLTVAACTSGISELIVVTDDETVIGEASAQGAIVVLEEGCQGIVRAANLGRTASQRLTHHEAVAVMVSDLPRLCSQDLTDVFAEYETHRRAMFVADHTGTGTTMIIHPRRTNPPILFGANSANRHRVAGYRAVRSAVPGLRADLDTPEDLAQLSSTSF